MSCEILSSEGAVFVVWGRVTTKQDIDRVFDRIKLIHSTTRQPVLYVTRVPADAQPPDAEVRAHLDKLMPTGIAMCSSYHVVLEGTGFVAGMKRAVLAGLFQISWRKSMFFVHSVPKELIFKLDRAQRPVGEKILQLAEARGLLEGPAPDFPFVRKSA
jgi:hypothetical protein